MTYPKLRTLLLATIIVPETAKPAETEPVHKIKAKAVEKSVNAAEVKKVVAAAPSLDNGNIKHSDEKAVAAAPVDGAKMSYAAMVSFVSCEFVCFTWGHLCMHTYGECDYRFNQWRKTLLRFKLKLRRFRFRNLNHVRLQ